MKLLQAGACISILFASQLAAAAAGGSDTARIEQLAGAKGKHNQQGDVFKVSLPRDDLQVTVGEVRIASPLGLTSWAAFAGSNASAVVDGDFAMREDELQTVLKALRRAGIVIVAIHNHMVGESPRIMFLHYWEASPAAGLAKGVKAALDATREK